MSGPLNQPFETRRRAPAPHLDHGHIIGSVANGQHLARQPPLVALVPGDGAGARGARGKVIQRRAGGCSATQRLPHCQAIGAQELLGLALLGEGVGGPPYQALCMPHTP